MTVVYCCNCGKLSLLKSLHFSQDGSHGCRVGFMPWEQAVGAPGHLLDGVVVRVFEVCAPEHPYSYCCTLFHRNHGYALAKVVKADD